MLSLVSIVVSACDPNDKHDTPKLQFTKPVNTFLDKRAPMEQKIVAPVDSRNKWQNDNRHLSEQELNYWKQWR